MDQLTGPDPGDFGDFILEVANEAEIDPRLLWAVVSHESRQNLPVEVWLLEDLAKSRVSDSASIGIAQMQLEAFEAAVNRDPGSFPELGQSSVRELWLDSIVDEELSIRAAAQLLASYDDHIDAAGGPNGFDERTLMAIGYNTGLPNVNNVLSGQSVGPLSTEYYQYIYPHFQEANSFYCAEGSGYVCESASS